MANGEEDASALLAYSKYTGTDGSEHLTRIPMANLQWVITAINAKTYYIKFDKNFAKKHLFTATKATDKVLAEAKRLWDSSTKMSKAYWLAKGYWRSYPAEYIAQAQANLDQAKVAKQAAHRTVAEQLICATCNHPKAKHETGSGAPVPCKFGGPASPCNCGPFIGHYSKKRAAQGKPTTNPLAGATSAFSTYVIMNKVPKKDFETVVTNAVIAAEGAGWPPNTTQHLDWDFGASRKGCVLMYDTGTKVTTEYQGMKVSAMNVTTDPTRPTYQVFHYDGVI